MNENREIKAERVAAKLKENKSVQSWMQINVVSNYERPFKEWSRLLTKYVKYNHLMWTNKYNFLVIIITQVFYLAS